MSAYAATQYAALLEHPDAELGVDRHADLLMRLSAVDHFVGFREQSRDTSISRGAVFDRTPTSVNMHEELAKQRSVGERLRRNANWKREMEMASVRGGAPLKQARASEAVGVRDTFQH